MKLGDSMKQLKSSMIQKQYHVNTMEESVLSAQVLIPSNIALIDQAIGGFKAGSMTYMYGESPLLGHFSYDLCAKTYHMFHEHSVFLDGGSSMNPYILARYAKTYEIFPSDLLQHVHVSRAFTMYQLSSLIYDHLEDLIQECLPKTVIVDAFPFLYQNPDASYEEAHTLFTETLSFLQKLTKKHHLIAVLTNNMRHWAHAPYLLHQVLFTGCDEVICIKQMKHCPRIWLPQYHHASTVTAGMQGQLCLQDFGMVIA